MTHRHLPWPLFLSCTIALAGCSAGGPEERTGGPVDGGGIETDGSTASPTDGGGEERDGGGGTADTDGSTTTPGEDAGGSEPSEITAHIDDSCDLSTFAGFQLTVGSMETTCATRASDSGDQLQITVGETTGAPPEGGRTYTIVASSSGPYPSDGEATAVLFGASTLVASSGTLTIAPAESGTFSGSYEVTLSDDTMRTGTFLADRCPRGAGDCE